MARQLVMGAGPIGRGIAARLMAQGHDVVLASRSGSGPEVPGVTRLAVPAHDAAAVIAAAGGAAGIFNALNPAYHRWPQDWPPMADALLTAAERTGAVLVTVSNLYAYGPVEGPIREELPLAAQGPKGRVRADMFAEAMAAHAAGRVRAVEVRGSDYIGPGAESHMGDRVVPRILAGKGVTVMGDPDAVHSWTFTADVARLAVAACADPSSHGRAWHVPSNPPRSQRQVVADLAAAAGMPAPRVSSYRRSALAVAGVFSPTIRELRETAYQFSAPFVMDSSAAAAHFGLVETPWPDVIAATLASFRQAEEVSVSRR